jgi:hypothetical protein
MQANIRGHSHMMTVNYQGETDIFYNPLIIFDERTVCFKGIT